MHGGLKHIQPRSSLYIIIILKISWQADTKHKNANSHLLIWFLKMYLLKEQRKKVTILSVLSFDVLCVKLLLSEQ